MTLVRQLVTNVRLEDEQTVKVMLNRLSRLCQRIPSWDRGNGVRLLSAWKNRVNHAVWEDDSINFAVRVSYVDGISRLTVFVRLSDQIVKLVLFEVRPTMTDYRGIQNVLRTHLVLVENTKPFTNEEVEQELMEFLSDYSDYGELVYE
jgi:hypothetical protein